MIILKSNPNTNTNLKLNPMYPTKPTKKPTNLNWYNKILAYRHFYI